MKSRGSYRFFHLIAVLSAISAFVVSSEAGACACLQHESCDEDRSCYNVGWIGFRVLGGGNLAAFSDDRKYRAFETTVMGFGEFSFFTTRWEHFYWEILRAGVGVSGFNIEDGMGYPPHWIIPFWGTSLGYPWCLKRISKSTGTGLHELRAGVNLLFDWGFWPGRSGVEVLYLWHYTKRLAIEFGIRMAVYTPILSASIGFKII
ncbi:MAG: hypothetical protein GY854_11125 [Deltaproteobacteria bacterium]|nr:hypothetical protein [Deltaproteobacteria bacterium]